MPDDEIFFRIGFSPDNASKNALQMLGDAVVGAQQRIDDSMQSLSESTIRASDRIVQSSVRGFDRSNQLMQRVRADSQSITAELSKGFDRFDQRVVGVESRLEHLKKKYMEIGDARPDFGIGGANQLVSRLEALEGRFNQFGTTRESVVKRMMDAEARETRAFVLGERAKRDAISQTNRALQGRPRLAKAMELERELRSPERQLRSPTDADSRRRRLHSLQSPRRRSAAQRAAIETSSVLSDDTERVDSKFADILRRIDQGKRKIEGIRGQLRSLDKEASFDELEFGFAQASIEANRWATEAQKAARRGLSAFSQVGQGVGELARAYALFEFSGTRVVRTQDDLTRSSSSSADEILRFAAKAQSAIDAFSGIQRTVGGFIDGVDSISTFLRARSLASKGFTNAAKLQQLASERRSRALKGETLALREASAAERTNLLLRQRSANAPIRRARRPGAAGLVAGGLFGGPEGLAIDAFQSLGASRRLRLFGLRSQRSLLGGVARFVNPVTSRAGLGTLATSGTGAVGAGLGGVAAAAAAAAAGIGVAGKAILDTGQRIAKGQRNFDVDSWADRIGQGTALVGDTLLDLVRPLHDFGDLIDDDAARRLEAANAKLKAAEALENRLNIIRADGERQRFAATRQFSQQFLEIKLQRAQSPSARRQLLRGEGNRLFAESIQFGADRAAALAENNQVEANAARAKEVQALQEVLKLRERERNELSSLVRDRRQSMLEEIRGTEDILKNRIGAANALRDSLKSNARRFVELEEDEQARLRQNFIRARRGEKLSIEDLQNLERIGTQQAVGLAERQFAARIRESGFTSFFGQDEAAQIRRAEEQAKALRDRLEAVGQQAKLTTVVPALEAIKAKIEVQPTVEIIDRTAFEVSTQAYEAALTRKLDEFRTQIIETLQEMQGRALAEAQEKLEAEARAQERNKQAPTPRDKQFPLGY